MGATGNRWQGRGQGGPSSLDAALQAVFAPSLSLVRDQWGWVTVVNAGPVRVSGIRVYERRGRL